MQEKYDLISISVISILFYTLSWIAVKSGLLYKVYHKRFWNSMLLLSFIVSGTLGFFLVFQINYDWDIDITEDLNFWHVELGIALFIIAIFHISWHLSYFSKLFNKSKTLKKEAIIPVKSQTSLKKHLKYAALGLGFTNFITQVVFIREFLSLFSGNELIIGVLFFNWLIITGLGAYVGKYTFRLNNPIKTTISSFYIFAIAPALTMFLMIFLKNKIFLPGTEVGLTQIIFYSFFIFFPVNIFSGFSFSLLSYLFLKIYNKKKAHLIYAYEAFGSVIGGLFFNFVFIYFLDDLRILFILLPFNIWIANLFINKLSSKIALNALALLIFGFLFYVPAEKYVKHYLFIGQKIIYEKNSPYGNIILTENSGQINFYENGVFLFSSDSSGKGNGNIAENEEAVHFAMLQCKHPEKVLLVSGGINGQLSEILKYPVIEIDYLEINPVIIDAAKHFIRLPENNKINYINADVRSFLKQNNKKYDAILLNAPTPLTTETNRFYTFEFFKQLKKHLKSGGIIKTQLPSSANYLSKESEIASSVLYASLSSVFKNIQVLPGEKDYFLASDKSININIVAQISLKKIKNNYIEYYLDDASLQQRAKVIHNRIVHKADINFDFKPISYVSQIKEQLSHFKTNYWILSVLVILFLIFVIKNMNKVNFGIFSLGFSLISTELFIIFSFQILYGNIYKLLSVIIMIFMLGMACGSLFFPKYSKILKYLAPNKPSPNKQMYLISFVILSIILIILPYLFIHVFSSIQYIWINYILIFLTAFIIAIIGGYIFYLSEQISKVQNNKIAGSIYSADLFGSATAALLISMYLFPVVGMEFTMLPAVLLCIATIIINKSN